MNAIEIRSQVLLGSHKNVKAFLAPLIDRVAQVSVGAVEVSYNGCGGIQVDGDNWASVLKTARAVQANCPELKVLKPWALQSDALAPITWRFWASVRP